MVGICLPLSFEENIKTAEPLWRKRIKKTQFCLHCKRKKNPANFCERNDCFRIGKRDLNSARGCPSYCRWTAWKAYSDRYIFWISHICIRPALLQNTKLNISASNILMSYRQSQTLEMQYWDSREWVPLVPAMLCKGGKKKKLDSNIEGNELL